jgi:hypothetical protein
VNTPLTIQIAPPFGGLLNHFRGRRKYIKTQVRSQGSYHDYRS